MQPYLEDFFKDDFSKSEEEKRNMIHEMIDILDTNQLSEVIEFLREPFFSKKLKDYLVDGVIPPMESPEFMFLLQSAKYNGNIVKKIVRKAGVSDYYFEKFIFKYNLEEVSKGMYLFPHKEIDGNFLFQNQYTRSVISHETALYMHDLSDVIPTKTTMSMPTSYKLSQIEKNEGRFVKIKKTLFYDYKTLEIQYYQNDPIYLVKNDSIGNTQIKIMHTAHGNDVRVTSVERTIADIFKPFSSVEEEVKEKALEKYFENKSNDKVRLLRIAKQQNVEHEIKNYLWKLRLYY